MRFLNRNNEEISGDQGFRLSRDVEDVTLEVSTGAEITFTVSDADDAGTFSFVVTPNTSRRTPIRVRDILESVAGSPDAPDELGAMHIFTVTLSATSTEGSATIEYDTVRGSCGGADNDFEIYSSRPQISKTYPWAKEYVTVRMTSSSGGTISTNAQLRIYPKGYPPMDILLPGFATNSNGIFVLDCSYNVAKDALSLYPGMENVDIIAYDLILSRTSPDAITRTLRFIVQKNDSRVDEFCFLNHFGAFDTIFANGAMTRKLESEVSVFVNNRLERELSNEYVEKFETNTGHLGTERMVKYWMSFLESASRFVLSGRTSWKRIIVDEISDADNERGKMGGFKFVWHLAEPVAGEIRDDIGILDEYQYEIPEL